MHMLHPAQRDGTRTSLHSTILASKSASSARTCLTLSPLSLLASYLAMRPAEPLSHGFYFSYARARLGLEFRELGVQLLDLGGIALALGLFDAFCKPFTHFGGFARRFLFIAVSPCLVDHFDVSFDVRLMGMCGFGRLRRQDQLIQF